MPRPSRAPRRGRAAKTPRRQREERGGDPSTGRFGDAARGSDARLPLRKSLSWRLCGLAALLSSATARASASRGPRACRRRARGCSGGARRSLSAICCRTCGLARAEPGHAVDHVLHEVEPIEVVAHHHVERRRGGALFLVAAHVHVLVVGAAVRQAMNEPRVAVVGEDDRAVLGEEAVEVAVRRARADARSSAEGASGPRR